MECLKAKICLLSSGRSGTKFTSEVFNALGFEVGHETMGKNGISSWCLVSDEGLAPYGPSWRELCGVQFYTAHQIRNPLSAILSLSTINKKSWRFIDETSCFELGKDVIVNSARHWLDWNSRAMEKSSVTWILEDWPKGVSFAMNEMQWDWSSEDLNRSIGQLKSVNSGKSRWKSLSTLKTSPQVAWRRWRHAQGKLKLNRQFLRDFDHGLEQEIFQLWSEASSKSDAIPELVTSESSECANFSA